MNDPVLQLEQISRNFGEQAVLRDINMDVLVGETLVLIGESGCGKSVTTKLLAGIMSPTSGCVYWQGTPLASMSKAVKQQQRLKIGYLFQSAALFDSLTVYQNVAFGLEENTQLSSGEIEQIVAERLVEVGLSYDMARKKPAELSGGMRKRVGLARALAISPEIIIYDEPTTGLDPVMSDVINELILKIAAEQQVTSIVVTHDMHTVKKVSDRIVMLYPLTRLTPHDPQIIFEGTAEEAFDHADPRVHSFVHGDASARLQELQAA